MPRRNKKKKKQQRRVEDETPFYVGKASYGPYDYQYKVWKDEGSYFIKFDGRFGPFTQAEREEDIQPYAQEILELFLDAAVDEVDRRLQTAFGFMNGEAKT